VDYAIRHRSSDLDSTGYMEIGPGRYDGKHWQDGFLFVREDAFGVAEGILARHLPEYDHFGMNDIPREVGLAVAADWREVAGRLPTASAAEVQLALNLGASYRQRLDEEVAARRVVIADLLRSLAEGFERFYRESEWVCVLGM
jgi:hypothetical protein